MKHSKDYGPQFDSSDGTIGELKLVKRYFVTRHNGQIFTARQGRYSRATQEDAEEYKRSIESSNSREQIGTILRVSSFWCYPNHFDPVGRA